MFGPFVVEFLLSLWPKLAEYSLRFAIKCRKITTHGVGRLPTTSSWLRCGSVSTSWWKMTPSHGIKIQIIVNTLTRVMTS